MQTDWKEIGITIGSITDYSERGGSNFATLAFEEILGTEWVEHTVNAAISRNTGSELAMNCLRLISSEKAAYYAYAIYKSTNETEDRRRLSVWLIKHLAVKKAYSWVEEFINDNLVIGWGIGVLEQLLWAEVIDYDDEKDNVEALLELALKNSNGELQDNVDFIRGYLNERRKRIENIDNNSE